MSAIPVLKVVIAGDGAVGKTSLIRRFCEGNSMSSRISTIGVDFQTQRVTLPSGIVKLSIWDMAGQDRFHDIRQGFYRGSRGAALVYDATAPVTMQNLPRWREEIPGRGAGPAVCGGCQQGRFAHSRHAGPLDQPGAAQHSRRAHVCLIHRCGVCPTSALSGMNVLQLFEQIAKLAYAHSQAGSGAH